MLENGDWEDSPIKLVQRATVPTRIREVIVSNLGSGTILTKGFRGFRQALQTVAGMLH